VIDAQIAFICQTAKNVKELVILISLSERMFGMFITPAMCKGLEREYLTYRFNQHTNYLTGFFRSPLLEPGPNLFFAPLKQRLLPMIVRGWN